MSVASNVVDLDERRMQRKVAELLRELADVQHLSFERTQARNVDWGRLADAATDVVLFFTSLKFEEGPAAA